MCTAQATRHTHERKTTAARGTVRKCFSEKIPRVSILSANDGAPRPERIFCYCFFVPHPVHPIPHPTRALFLVCRLVSQWVGRRGSRIHAGSSPLCGLSWRSRDARHAQPFRGCSPSLSVRQRERFVGCVSICHSFEQLCWFVFLSGFELQRSVHSLPCCA